MAGFRRFRSLNRCRGTLGQGPRQPGQGNRAGEHRPGEHRTGEHRPGEHRTGEHRAGGHRAGGHRAGDLLPPGRGSIATGQGIGQAVTGPSDQGHRTRAIGPGPSGQGHRAIGPSGHRAIGPSGHRARDQGDIFQASRAKRRFADLTNNVGQARKNQPGGFPGWLV